MKYVRRVVWYAPDTTDSVASMALSRMSTIPGQIVPYLQQREPTVSPGSYRNVQRRHEIGEDSIDTIQPSQDIYYIRAWVRVFLWEDRSKKYCRSLILSALFRPEVIQAYIKSMRISRSTSCLDARHRPRKELSRLHL
jgi:hypothetical protein